MDQSLTTTIGGPPVTATITQAGAVSRVRFAGEAGQTVVVDAKAGTLPDACGVISLLQPDGTALSDGCLINGKGTLPAAVLPTTATYTLLIDPSARDTGSVQVNVHSWRAFEVHFCLSTYPSVSHRRIMAGFCS